MSDSMQVDAMERLRQMYSKAQPNTKSVAQNTHEHKEQNITEKHDAPRKVEPQLHTQKSENLLEIFMQDKEKSLIMLLIVLLISEKADSTLVLALMYLIL